MPEKNYSGIGIVSVVSCFSLASAFRHQGLVRYRWSRTNPALPSYATYSLRVERSVDTPSHLHFFHWTLPIVQYTLKLVLKIRRRLTA
jgi:hypothetical protein